MFIKLAKKENEGTPYNIQKEIASINNWQTTVRRTEPYPNNIQTVTQTGESGN